MRIIYSTRDVKPFPLRGGKTSKRISEREPRYHVSHHVPSRVESVRAPATDTQCTRTNSTAPEVALSRVESESLPTKIVQECTKSCAPLRATSVSTPSAGKRQQAKNMVPEYKPSRVKSVPAAAAREKQHAEHTVRTHLPARAKSVTAARGKGLHVVTGSDAGSLLVSGKKLHTRNVVTQVKLQVKYKTRVHCK